MAKKKATRVRIPQKTQLKLWLKCGGKCSFPGCKKFLWREGLTLREGNYAEIAHIVAEKEDGPRGDKVKSPELATAYSNLILMCKEHHSAIDKRENVSFFTVERLVEMKRLHESFIERALTTPSDNQRTVIRLMGNIQGLQLAHAPIEALRAMMFTEGMRIPKDESGIDIDLTTFDPPRNTADWTLLGGEISRRLHRGLELKMDGDKDQCFSVFGIAPIPLLMLLGKEIPNTIRNELYQLQRDGTWRLGLKADAPIEYQLIAPQLEEHHKNVVLKLSVSGEVQEKEINKVVEFPRIYELRSGIQKPGLIQSIDDIQKFGTCFQKALGQIREDNGPDVKVHLFPAVPNAIAIKCGLSLIQKSHPEIIVYDNDKSAGGFMATITI